MGPLDHSPADVVRRLLIAKNLGAAPPTGPWPVYAAAEPFAPDNCITVYDTTARDGGREMVGGVRLEHEGVQIRVRAVDHPTGWAKAKALADAMDTDVRNETVTVGGTAYTVCAITRTSGPIPLPGGGKDDPNSKRTIFTINAIVALNKNV